MCTCFLIWNFTILHIYPLGSPPHSHIVGILLHIIKSEAQRSEEIKLEPRRELHSSKLTVFQVAYLQQKSWEFCFELQLSLEQDDLIGRCYPSLKNICLLSTSIDGKCLPSYGQRENDSYHWANAQDKSQTLESGKLVVALIITAF